MTRTIKTKILLKTSTCKEWEENPSFVPLQGEVCVYIDRTKILKTTGELDYYIPGLKIGDGSSTIAELPFINDEYTSEEEIDALFSEK